MPDLGFRFAAWNGVDEEHSASLSVSCGATHPKLVNNALVRLGAAWADDLSKLTLILEAAVLAFDPDDGIIRVEVIEDPQDDRPIWQRPAIVSYNVKTGMSKFVG